MKKKLLSILIMATMVATMFVGCGDANDKNTETTNDNNTEVVENTEGINLIPETEEEELFSKEFAWKFPEGMEGFTNKSIYADDETWSSNGTHYVAKNGNVMDFKWEGPAELGESARAGEKTLFLADKNDNYKLAAWFGGLVDESGFNECLTLSKDDWTSYSTGEAYYNGGYYDIKTTDTTIEVIFEVAGEEYVGYNYFVTDLNEELCYQFSYLEKPSIYDNERAMSVINSIDFWNMEIVE